MSCLLLAIQPDHLNNAHLQQLVHTRNLIEDLQDVLDRLGHRALGQENKRVAFARRVGLRGEESLDELRRIGDEVLELAIDRVYGEHGVLAYVRMPVLEAGAARRNEGLE